MKLLGQILTWFLSSVTAIGVLYGVFEIYHDLQDMKGQTDEIVKSVMEEVTPQFEQIKETQLQIQCTQEAQKDVTKKVILQLKLNTEQTVNLIEELNEKKKLTSDLNGLNQYPDGLN